MYAMPAVRVWERFVFDVVQASQFMNTIQISKAYATGVRT